MQLEMNSFPIFRDFLYKIPILILGAILVLD